MTDEQFWALIERARKTEGRGGSKKSDLPDYTVRSLEFQRIDRRDIDSLLCGNTDDSDEIRLRCQALFIILANEHDLESVLAFATKWREIANHAVRSRKLHAAYDRCYGGFPQGWHDLFIDWLILQGQEYFELVTSDPDLLCDQVVAIDASGQLALSCLARQTGLKVCMLKTGEYEPEYIPLTWASVPEGPPYDREYMSTSFPHLWSAYGADWAKRN